MEGAVSQGANIEVSITSAFDYTSTGPAAPGVAASATAAVGVAGIASAKT